MERVIASRAARQAELAEAAATEAATCGGGTVVVAAATTAGQEQVDALTEVIAVASSRVVQEQERQILALQAQLDELSAVVAIASPDGPAAVPHSGSTTAAAAAAVVPSDEIAGLLKALLGKQSASQPAKDAAGDSSRSDQIVEMLQTLRDQSVAAGLQQQSRRRASMSDEQAVNEEMRLEKWQLTLASRERNLELAKADAKHRLRTSINEHEVGVLLLRSVQFCSLRPRRRPPFHQPVARQRLVHHQPVARHRLVRHQPVARHRRVRHQPVPRHQLRGSSTCRAPPASSCFALYFPS
jgi:hypothetical protein